MVLNIHTGTSSDVNVLRDGTKPRINEFNRKYVHLIWDDDEHQKLLKMLQLNNK